MKNKLFTYLRSAGIVLALCAMTLQANALGQKELQQLLDGSVSSQQKRASAGGFVEIDLSDYTEPISGTLYVRAQNIRFVNGTLKQELYYDFTLIQIQNGYQLELAETATLQGNNYPSEKPFVEIQSGKFSINGGHISGIFNVNKPHDFGNAQVLFSSPRNVSIDLSGGSNAEFSLINGSVEGSVKNNLGGIMKVYSGNVDHVKFAAGTFGLSGNATINEFVELDGTRITLMSSLQKDLHIAGYTKDQVILEGHLNLLNGSDDLPTYVINEADLEKILLNENTNNYKLSLEGAVVYVREDVLDYNNITNEDDLQKALDAIATQNTGENVKLTIAPQGITLTHAIRANANCRATITGGTIHVGGETSYGSALSGSDFMFLVDDNAFLRFEDIAIDFHNLTLNMTAFWNNGFLTIDRNVEFLNVSENVVYDRNEFYLNRKYLTLYSGKLPEIKGLVLNNGGHLDTSTAYSTIMYGNLFVNPRIYNTAGASICIDSKLESVWTFEGNWIHYELEKNFISGFKMYELDASDYWQMRFDGLPSTDLKRTVYYDGQTKSVKLKTYQSLQDLLDADDDGETDVPCDGLDVAKDLTLEKRMQWLLDGSDCPQHVIEPPTIWMPGGCMFIQTPAQIKDITFDSFSSGHRLYVRNRTEFIDKVVARNFIWFSIIEEGGHLIWHNAETENVQYPIVNNGGTADILAGKLTGNVYNAGTLNLCGCVQLDEIQVHPEGVVHITSPITSQWVLDLTFDSTISYPNGLVIMEGANGYKLTAEDFNQIQFRLPAGCEVRFDSSCNAIVLTNTLGVAGVKMDVDDDAPIYSLKGYKVAKPEKGQLYIKNNRKYLMR